MYRSAEDVIRDLSEIYVQHVHHVAEIAMVDNPLPDEDKLIELTFDLTPKQIEDVEDLNERFTHWVRIVAAYLERVQTGYSQALVDEASRLSTWFLFQRSARGERVAHDVWRSVYLRESHQIVNALARTVADNADEFSHGSSHDLRFVDVDIRMSRSADGYAVVVDSQMGSAVGAFQPPHDPRDVENFVLRYCSPRGAIRRAVPNSITPFSKFGGALFDALIRDSVREVYSVVRAHASASGQGVRIRLRQNGVPELVRIPWEFLFDGSGFICLEPRTTLVRHFDTRLARPPLSVRLPLRILVTISSPPDLPSLEVDVEADRLRVALGPYIEMGLIDLAVARDGQLSTVQRTLAMGLRAGKPWHVWHFIGHGVFDERDRAGYLAFESTYGKRLVSGFEMATLFRDYDSLRLVVMNACETAASDDVDAVSGVAGAIVEGGVSTVVAMQFPVSDHAAISFAARFYSSISDGLPADAAVTEARRGIFFQPNYGEWATPVVFTRSAGTEVFAIVD